MSTDKKPLGYWMNKDNCYVAARQCKTRSEFRRRFSAAYKNSLRLGWIDDICSFMIPNQRSRGYWNDKNHCKEAVLQCKTQKEFRKRFRGAYTSCRNHGWFEELCSELKIERDIHKWSTLEAVFTEAQKYKSRTEFSHKNGAAYAAAHRLGIIDVVCSHMESKNDYCSRGIYSFEFPDKHVYVGLTYNFVIRRSDHLNSKDSQVYRYIQLTGIMPEFKVLHAYTDMYVAAQLEADYLEKYKNEGWITLNVQVPGNLGGSFQYYTHKRVMELAHTCETLLEFRMKYDQAYQAARKHRWLKEIKEFLPSSVNQYGSFQNTYHDVMAYARTCKTYREFSLGKPSAVKYARRKGFIDEITAILPPQAKTIAVTNKYSYDDVLNLAKHCRDLRHLRNDYGSAYNAALKNGWIDDVQKLLPRQVHRAYQKVEVISLAESCNNYDDFYEGYASAYNAALNNGWINEIRMMFCVKAQSPEYKLEDVLRVAKNCKSYREFQNYHSIYQAARKKGWLNEVYKILPRQMHTIYKKEDILNLARNCSTYLEFETRHPGAYNVARKNDWLDEVQEILPRIIRKPFTKKDVLEIASSCIDYTEFTNKYRMAYKAACNKGWLKEIQAILPVSTRKAYTKEEIIALARKCDTYTEFQTNYASAYVAAGKHGWKNELRLLFNNVKRKPYTKADIMEIVSHCNSYTDFCKQYRNAYKAASRLDLLDIIKELYRTK